MPVHRTSPSPRLTLACERCGAAFSVPPSQVKSGGGRFCSMACRRHQVRLACAHCGAPLSRKASAAARRVGATYCDMRCKGLAWRAATALRAEQVLSEPLQTGIARRLAAGETMRSIVEACGLNDDRALHKIMDALGIPRRSPSEAVRMQWVNNPERRAAQRERLGAYVRADPDRARAQSIAANLKLQSTSPTSIERALMVALDAAGIVYEFQYVVGGKFLCDFGFPDAMLIVETDGSYWHRTERQKKRDASKDAYLRACGYTVIRLAEPDIKHRLDSCLDRIRDRLRTKLG
jgi:very-short-patch-repair endonuclease